MSNANETQEVQYHIDELYRRLARIQGELATLRFTLAITVAKSDFTRVSLTNLRKLSKTNRYLRGFIV